MIVASNQRRYADILPAVILFSGFGVLALGWIGFLLIDLFDIFGLGTALYEKMQTRSPSRAWLWVLLFTEGAAIEIVQWLLLATAAGLSFHLHGSLSGRKNPSGDEVCARAFWLLMGIAFLLMLVEDAGNARHWIRQFVQFLLGGQSGAITEFIYFGTLAAIPVSALVFFGRPVVRIKQTRYMLLAGFFCYGMAAGGSATRYYWYEAAGQWLHVHIFREGLKIVEVGSHGHGFWLMDYLLEESLELAGATLLAAMAATFLRRTSLKC